MKVVVVGNAASTLSKTNGKLIDSFDVVVRMNKYKTFSYEDYVGSKTDIYCSKWLNMKDNINNIKEYKELWLPYPEPPHWWNSRGNFNEYTREECKELANRYKATTIKYLSKKGTEEFDKIFERTCHPSTGLICLEMAIEQFPSSKIYYTGFDAFSSGWYWEPQRNCTINMKNSILFEKVFINHLRTKYGIQELT